MRTRLALAALRDEAALVVGHIVATTVLLAPAIGLMVLVLNAHNLPPTAQKAILVLLAAAELAWFMVWAWDVHVLAGKLERPKNLARLKSVQFQVWQSQRDMNLLFPGYGPLEELNIVRRYILARRLYAYTRQVTHTRLWERALRLLPRQFTLYVAIHASMNKLFAVGRMTFIRRTGDFSGDAWTAHVADQVEAIYAH